MWYPRLQAIAVMLLVLVPGYTTLAQTEPGGRPQVGFVVDGSLGTASSAENAADGISELADIFRGLGADIRTIELGQPIPDNIDVVVLVRPLRRLSSSQTAHLWSHLLKGNDLLVTLDPNDYAEVRTERAADGLNQILKAHYGLSVEDGLLVEPWFTIESLQSFYDSYAAAEPEDTVVHPIIEPLLNQHLPVLTWASRPVITDLLGPGSEAFPLIYTDTAFSEVSNIFADENPAPIEFNTGADRQGRIHIGGAGINRATGSRVVLLGDSELVSDQYGLARVGGSERTVFVGNEILAERSAAWLLDLPTDQWPQFPAGYTWISIDGQSDDWNAERPRFEDLDDESVVPEFDIKAVQAFHNDQFMYLMIETAGQPDPNVQVELRLQQSGLPDQPGQFVHEAGFLLDEAGGQTLIPDAGMAVQDVIEIRVPLRVSGLVPRIADLCLVSAEGEEALDCYAQTLAPPNADELAPTPLLFPAISPLAIIRAGEAVNVRSGPGVSFRALGALAPDTLLHAVGRDANGEWIKVETGRYSGWVWGALVNLGGDVSKLVVAEP